MLHNYLDMVLYDTQTALVTAAVAMAGCGLAVLLHRKGRHRLLRGLLGLGIACLAAAAAFWYGEGGFGGGIAAMTLCLFGLPALAGLAAGWGLAAHWRQIRRHRVAAAALAALLCAALLWAWPRPLANANLPGLPLPAGYVSEDPALYNSNVLVTEDGGASWQIAKVRDADEIDAAIGGIRCGPQYLYLNGLPSSLPDEQLIVPLGDRVLLLSTRSGPSYLIQTDSFHWHSLLEHDGLRQFALPRQGLRGRVMGYPALYQNIAVWLTAPA